MSALEDAAQAWVEEVHPHARHLVRARDWVVELDPDASEAVRIAAVLHDIERAFPDSTSTWDSSSDWDDPHYNRWHQDRCATVADEWLKGQRAGVRLRDDVRALIAAHEDGGWPAADLVQAGDSLSFLETMTHLIVRWVCHGIPIERAKHKLYYTVDRVSVPAAKAPLRELLAQALEELDAVPETRARRRENDGIGDDPRPRLP